MTLATPAALFDVRRRPGSPPLLHADPADDAPGWASEHRDALRAVLVEHGSVLVRGLGLRDAAGTAAVFRALAPAGLHAEREAFAPRTTVADGVFTSTTWPANQPMCMHHELSYTLRPPRTLLFACLTPPAIGGATGLADGPSVLGALPHALVDRFERDGWMLLRSYDDEIGASWEQAFGTDDRGAVEAYCRRQGIELAWQPDGGLRTRQRRRAVVRHPVRGQRCWFNQVAFLNAFTLAPDVREFLLDVYGPDGLPFTTASGDGSPVEEDVVELVNAVYVENTAREPWQAGDLLVVDNIRTAHSREPFEGRREVLVVFSPFGLGVLDLAVGKRVYDEVVRADDLHVVEDFSSERRHHG